METGDRWICRAERGCVVSMCSNPQLPHCRQFVRPPGVGCQEDSWKRRNVRNRLLVMNPETLLQSLRA